MNKNEVYAYYRETLDGIKASGVKREDIFVTTKHWVTMRGYEKATEGLILLDELLSL